MLYMWQRIISHVPINCSRIFFCVITLTLFTFDFFLLWKLCDTWNDLELSLEKKKILDIESPHSLIKIEKSHSEHKRIKADKVWRQIIWLILDRSDKCQTDAFFSRTQFIILGIRLRCRQFIHAHQRHTKTAKQFPKMTHINYWLNLVKLTFKINYRK